MISHRIVPKRERLTPHQREVLDRLTRIWARTENTWVPLKAIGSHGALNHLVHKGWAKTTKIYGPRGGELRFYKPI